MGGCSGAGPARWAARQKGQVHPFFLCKDVSFTETEKAKKKKMVAVPMSRSVRTIDAAFP